LALRLSPLANSFHAFQSVQVSPSDPPRSRSGAAGAEKECFGDLLGQNSQTDLQIPHGLLPPMFVTLEPVIL
jgi:hypothetical protein